MFSCLYCGDVDADYDEGDVAIHNASQKHQCNKILYQYNQHKEQFKRNKEGLEVMTSVPDKGIDVTDKFKIIINARPNETVKFVFQINNKSRHDVMIVGIGLGHPQPQFTINNHGLEFGSVESYALEHNSTMPRDVFVSVCMSDIGQMEMPTIFTFQRMIDEKVIIFVRELVVMVTDNPQPAMIFKNPFTNKSWDRPQVTFPCKANKKSNEFNRVPHAMKMLFSQGMTPIEFDPTKVPADKREICLQESINIKSVLDEGITKDNYESFWTTILWWEEIVLRINMKRYNMTGVQLMGKGDSSYIMEVPGLAERRPSLLRGDRVFLRKSDEKEIAFEGCVNDIQDNHVEIKGLDPVFDNLFLLNQTKYDVRFLMSRMGMERMHRASSMAPQSVHFGRIFPERNAKIPELIKIDQFYNPAIRDNPEQAAAVQHIISGTSGRAPYMVFGPPGTGKTMTVVEAIIQLVLRNSNFRIMVCTDSNMAADHVACSILKYHYLFKQRQITNFLFRCNSRNRLWEVMPRILHPYSNGNSFETSYSVSNEMLSKFRVIVLTLQHSAKFGICRSNTDPQLRITHLFIDEAAQSHEPACLIPIVGFMERRSQLILAGDPKQLGPVCLTSGSSQNGLGISLMERLKMFYDMYDGDRNYITMLKKNFRSHPDILFLPNKLFYEQALEPVAEYDKLSEARILKEYEAGGAAVVFHGVNSKEQRIGISPSYFNEKEIEMIQRYVRALIYEHHVLQEDIGVIAPYMRQVHKIKQWLLSQNYHSIDVGTVEAFQGKEKRVILVTTVRANCRLLDYDAKYGLGFLVDDKRFNVTLTRAKAKAIFVGNPACLSRDLKWRLFMSQCKELNSYLGSDTEQLPRSVQLLREITLNRFKKFRISDRLKDAKDPADDLPRFSRAFMEP